MSDQNSEQSLKNELKEFIDTTHTMMEKGELSNQIEENDLSTFAERILNLHRYSSEILNEGSKDENTVYNARIINDLTNLPIYDSKESKESCSLIAAAAELKKAQEFTKIKTIVSNLITNPAQSEVLLDDLMVIYKELAA